MTDPNAVLSFDQIRTDVAERLGVDDPATISDDEDLSVAGLDSIELMVPTERWREAGVEVSYIELAESPRLCDWWACMRG